MRVRDEVARSHPALPGHFPGNPVVPGALLLGRIARAAANAYGRAPASLSAARFHAPLRPGEAYDIVFEPEGDSALRFRVLRDATLIAAGTFRLGMGLRR